MECVYQLFRASDLLLLHMLCYVSIKQNDTTSNYIEVIVTVLLVGDGRTPLFGR